MRDLDELDGSVTENVANGSASALVDDACDLLILARAQQERLEEYGELVSMDMGGAIDKLIELSSKPL